MTNEVHGSLSILLAQKPPLVSSSLGPSSRFNSLLSIWHHLKEGKKKETGVSFEVHSKFCIYYYCLIERKTSSEETAQRSFPKDT